MKNNSNELNPIFDPFLLVYSLGITFMIASTLHLSEIVNLGSHYFLAITLSGFFFVLADFLLLGIKVFKTKGKLNELLVKFIKPTRIISLFLSIFVIIVVPHISLPNKFNLQTVSEFFALMTIGITIMNISINQVHTHSNNLKAQENRDIDLLKKVKKMGELSEKLATDVSESVEMTNKSLQLSLELSKLSQELLQNGIDTKTENNALSAIPKEKHQE